MIEISKYLTNQLLAERYLRTIYMITIKRDEKLALDHLAHFPMEYFDEYNSKPYQTFTFQVLELLYFAANDEELRNLPKVFLMLPLFIQCYRLKN